MAKNKKHHIGKLYGTERCTYCGCTIKDTLYWLYDENDIRYCMKHGRSGIKGELPNCVKNESEIYKTIGLNTLTFINNYIKETIDIGDECGFVYNKYFEYSSIYFFGERIVTLIIFNKILRALFNTGNRSSGHVRVWNNLVYHEE